MPLEDWPIEIDSWEAPPEVESLVLKADRSLEKFLAGRPRANDIPEFQASTLRVAYQALHAIVRDDPAPGRSFCEWGSGLGGVTCLAAKLGLRACGIEIEEELVKGARELAEECGVSVEFHLGSYKPPGIHMGDLDTTEPERALGFSPTDFDIIYVYAWPAEERAVLELFERCASPGTILVTYRGGADIRVRRKTRARDAQPD